ncbi:MAG: hypothetical protein QXY83_05615 [Thermosphaera sp.]
MLKRGTPRRSCLPDRTVCPAALEVRGVKADKWGVPHSHGWVVHVRALQATSSLSTPLLRARAEITRIACNWRFWVEAIARAAVETLGSFSLCVLGSLAEGSRGARKTWTC